MTIRTAGISVRTRTVFRILMPKSGRRVSPVLWLAALFVSSAGLLTASASDESTGRPNIVLIFADDLGWRDVGFQSDGIFLTPQIDRLATQGMVFTDAYAAAGNCAPSRACLLSGTYTPRHHVYAVGSTNRGPKNLMRLTPVPNRSGLNRNVVTIADALKSAGYATGHFGKWHLHGPDGSRPSEQGFDETYDSFGDGEVKEGSEGNKAGPPEDPKGVFTLTRKACDFMERQVAAGKPFFCYLPHHAIHTPLQTTPETRKVQEQRRQDGQPSAAYLGCTYDLDDSVGRLLRKLDDLGITDNTLVVFTSDNGATPGSSQEPLRGNKGGYYEGGIREPFIVRWPGVVAAGSRCSVPVINVDLFPTFLAAAGMPVPEGVTLDGESLLPLMKQSGPLARKAVFWHFPGYLDQPVTRGRDPVFRTRPVTVIREDNWKLHLYHEEWFLDGGQAAVSDNNSVELYDLSNDIGERINMAEQHSDVRDRLIAGITTWWQSTEAVLPAKPNPAFDPQAENTNGSVKKKRGKDAPGRNSQRGKKNNMPRPRGDQPSDK
ncbi:MAG: sulfatase [Planctomycetaceae bacterium]|nr:sulfatase [Planctomycetaceae bacterium]